MSIENLCYIETPKDGADKYHGEVATGYRAKREQSDKWKIEQRIIEDMLGSMPEGNWVLDVPCGEGRFFEFYHDRGYIFRGVDKSADMLRLAANMVVDPSKARLGQADIRQLPMNDKCVDATVMCRITRWLSPEDCQRAFKEAMRVTRDRIVITARVANHPHARPLELFTDVLEDGWELARNEAGYVEDYRILMFKRKTAK